MKICLLGAGNFGTTIANVVAKNGHEVRLWNWEGDPKPIEQIRKHQENKKYLPDIRLSENIKPTFEMDEAVKDADMVFYIVASSAIKKVVEKSGKYINKEQKLVNFTKGIDSDSLQLTTKIISNLDASKKENIATIAGPAIANQLSQGQFTAMNIASNSQRTISQVEKVLENDYLRLSAVRDMIGIQLGSAFKNVYAIALGVADGFDLPLNTKSALLTIALKEISELSVAMGGRKETVYSLAGVGDLVGTALAKSSRNRTFGEYLAQGYSLSEAKQKVNQTIEGIEAVKVLSQLAEKNEVKHDFAKLIYSCVQQEKCVINKRKLFSLIE